MPQLSTKSGETFDLTWSSHIIKMCGSTSNEELRKSPMKVSQHARYSYFVGIRASPTACCQAPPQVMIPRPAPTPPPQSHPRAHINHPLVDTPASRVIHRFPPKPRSECSTPSTRVSLTFHRHIASQRFVALLDCAIRRTEVAPRRII